MEIKVSAVALLLSALFWQQSNAQRSVLSAGGDGVGSSGSISYSVGQIDFLAVDATSGKSNQGLQVPWEITVESGITQTSIELKALAYPNPVLDELQLSVGNFLSEGMSYRIYDLQGKLLMEHTILEETTRVNLSGFASATYVLQIIFDQNPIKTFRIVKKH
jgi:hypothetical protein